MDWLDPSDRFIPCDEIQGCFIKASADYFATFGDKEGASVAAADSADEVIKFYCGSGGYCKASEVIEFKRHGLKSCCELVGALGKDDIGWTTAEELEEEEQEILGMGPTDIEMEE